MRKILVWPCLLAVTIACQQGYTLCAPPGATSTALPPAGPALTPLYSALLSAVKDEKAPPAPGPPRAAKRSSDQFCCIGGTACLELSTFSLPFCYDKFTTNFRFYDGSDGVLVQGSLQLANGPKFDLIHGNYEGGGNIYGTSAPPNTATLPLPTPYTASGVGSAIPLTNLGGIATVTTTIPGTTITGTTMQDSWYPTTLTEDGKTQTTAATKSGTTVPGVTIAAKTLTFTVTGASSSSSSALAPEGDYAADIGARIAWGLFALVFA